MNKVKKFLYSQKAAPYVFIFPFVLTVILFWVFPIANGVLLSFQDVLKNKWVGMSNYKRLLSDTYFIKAVWNSFKYMVGTLVLLIPFPMLFAKLCLYFDIKCAKSTPCTELTVTFRARGAIILFLILFQNLPAADPAALRRCCRKPFRIRSTL